MYSKKYNIYPYPVYLDNGNNCIQPTSETECGRKGIKDNDQGWVKSVRNVIPVFPSGETSEKDSIQLGNLQCPNIHQGTDKSKNWPMIDGHVQTNQWMGRWSELASIPQPYQKDCNYSVAEYKLAPRNEYVQVKNLCFQSQLIENLGKRWIGSFAIEGKAYQVGVGRYFVDFGWDSGMNYTVGNFWILYFSLEQGLMVVGSPDRESLWILTKLNKNDIPASISSTLYGNLLSFLKNIQGYDVSKIRIRQ